jgi:hypothetical protein
MSEHHIDRRLCTLTITQRSAPECVEVNELSAGGESVSSRDGGSADDDDANDAADSVDEADDEGNLERNEEGRPLANADEKLGDI